ncbi:DUF1476 domain-containing protein [Telmatospirillum sp. J64-1]|uniref:DUF1476 domain-containing protein n=1 Tax=Telmatospirillum sp. J64-1 TaxID=2502183 RepID=UPI00115D6D4A|nr:DUF1476 domain-containing protein [Telmatospirillum sp. J64-1]
MTTFDEREKAFEAKYRLDMETAFRINARRDKLLGYWLADKFGLSGADADAYARSVVEADFEEPGDNDVIRKVMKDCQERNLDISESALRQEMDRLMAVAHQQILGEENSAS